MDRLYSAAKRAIVSSLKVKKGEKLLLVTDRQKMKIAEALAYWAKKGGAAVTRKLHGDGAKRKGEAWAKAQRSKVGKKLGKYRI